MKRTAPFTICCLLALSNLSAQVLTWSGGAGNGNWSDTGNWTTAQVPANTNSLSFNNAVQTSQTATTVSLTQLSWGAGAGSFSVNGGQLTFNQAGGGIVNSSSSNQSIGSNLVFATNAQTINNGGQTLALGKAGSTIAINQSLTFEGAGTTSLTGTITLGASPTFTVNAGTVTVNSAIGESGTRALLKGGSGRLELLAANTYSGNFTLLGGTVAVGSDSAFGTGSFNMGSGGSTSGILESIGGADRTFNNTANLQRNLTLQGGGKLTFNGSATGTLGSSPVLTINSGTTLQINHSLTGTPASIRKEGTGKLVLTGNNSFSGTWAVNAGELEISNTSGNSGAGSGGLTVAAGATLSGTGTLNNSSIVINGTLAPAGSSSGTIHFSLTNPITFSATSVLALQSGDTMSFAAAGNWLSVSSGAKLDLSGTGWTTGWTTFATNINSLPANVWALSAASITAGFALDSTSAFRLSGNDLQFNLSAVPEPSTVVLGLMGLGALLLVSKRASRLRH